jgi:hypothetical protein
MNSMMPLARTLGPLGRSLVSAAAPAVSWWLSGGIAAINCRVAYQAKGAASLAASYSNLANPGTDDAIPIVAPTWATATGWGFTGTQYLSTVVPKTGQDQSALIRYSFAGIDYHYLSAVSGIHGGLILFGFFIGPDYPSWYNGNNNYIVTCPSSAVMAISGISGYFDGIPAATIPISSGGYNSQPLYIGGFNNGGTLETFTYVGNIQAFAMYDTTLTDAQVLAVSTAMAAL